MLMVLRHLVAILLLPVVVTVVVPTYLLSHPGDSRWQGDDMLTWLARAAALVIFAIGVSLLGCCVLLFARVGQGTLAPWDPTHRLVAVGPYRVVRNPMIAGVALILAAEASWWGSWHLALWLAAFVLINHAYFLLIEEPGMRRRFGESYDAYASRVPRWLPRPGRRWEA